MKVVNPLQLQILRSLDKADRMEPVDVFDLLTTGRRDPSGDFMPGCKLDASQAAFLVSFVYTVKQPQIGKRLRMIEHLESTDVGGGRTAWDVLLDAYRALPEPKDIATILDDLIAHAADLCAQTTSLR